MKTLRSQILESTWHGWDHTVKTVRLLGEREREVAWAWGSAFIEVKSKVPMVSRIHSSRMY